MDSSNNNEKLEIKEIEAETVPPAKDDVKKSGGKKEKEKKPVVQEIFEWVEIIALSLSFVLLMFTYVARQAKVDGSSMRETFHHGEAIVISNLFYTPKQGDVIVFQVPGSTLTTEPIIKRVIAVGGQTVYIDFDNWKVYVYDDSSLTVEQVISTVTPLDEPYIEAMRESTYPNQSMKNAHDHVYPLTLEEGTLFCMGDNRNGSTDSRSSMLGPVDTRYVLGKVIFRIYPFTTKF